MIQLPAGVSNRLWILRSLGPWKAFQMAAENSRSAQLRRLRSILRWNAASEYGKRFGFRGLRTVEEFRERVPLVRYDDLAPEMEAIQSGREGVLTTEPVLLLQPSSGSTAASKLIPYTGALRREFNRAVSIWMADLFWARPELMDGPAYWSVSPKNAELPKVSGSIPVGFDDDAAYLGGLTRSIVQGALAVPGEVGKIRDLEDHRYATLRYLLSARDLRMISAWSPTFLALLLEPLGRWWDRLLEDVEQGALTLPNGSVTLDLPLPPPDPRRGRELREVGPGDLPGIWPWLGLISAWADGASAPYAQDLRRSFPGVPFQPKGLIATEAFVTIPRWHLPGSHPAITSHFFEFLPEGAGVEEALLVDQLTDGHRYEVVVTTGGGLYRYRLGDLVEVVEHAEGLPCLRFGGRADRVSDLFGEKLSDGFVTNALEELCDDGGLEPTFSLLAPEEVGGRPRYVWFLGLDRYVEGVGARPLDPNTGDTLPPHLARELDKALSESFHYANCRRLGQLDAPEVRLVPDTAAARYLVEKGEEARRLGDVKIPALETETGWGEVLAPRVVDP